MHITVSWEHVVDGDGPGHQEMLLDFGTGAVVRLKSPDAEPIAHLPNGSSYVAGQQARHWVRTNPEQVREYWKGKPPV